MVKDKTILLLRPVAPESASWLAETTFTAMISSKEYHSLISVKQSAMLLLPYILAMLSKAGVLNQTVNCFSVNSELSLLILLMLFVGRSAQLSLTMILKEHFVRLRQLKTLLHQLLEKERLNCQKMIASI